jgi:hypothetical protein
MKRPRPLPYFACEITDPASVLIPALRRIFRRRR